MTVGYIIHHAALVYGLSHHVRPTLTFSSSLRFILMPLVAANLNVGPRLECINTLFGAIVDYVILF